jgi:hypothetical protein
MQKSHKYQDRDGLYKTRNISPVYVPIRLRKIKAHPIPRIENRRSRPPRQQMETIESQSDYRKRDSHILPLDGPPTRPSAVSHVIRSRRGERFWKCSVSDFVPHC